jgi:hypothetical protein
MRGKAHVLPEVAYTARNPGFRISFYLAIKPATAIPKWPEKGRLESTMKDAHFKLTAPTIDM